MASLIIDTCLKYVYMFKTSNLRGCGKQQA